MAEAQFLSSAVAGQRPTNRLQFTWVSLGRLLVPALGSVEGTLGFGMNQAGSSASAQIPEDGPVQPQVRRQEKLSRTMD